MLEPVTHRQEKCLLTLVLFIVILSDNQRKARYLSNLKKILGDDVNSSPENKDYKNKDKHKCYIKSAKTWQLWIRHMSH